MPPIVKNLLLSKKFIVALLTAAGAVAMYFGWNVDPTKIAITISPLLVFVGAQGWADSGKEQALVSQATELQLQQAAHAHELQLTQMAQAHEVKMASTSPPPVPAAAKGGQPGFVLLEAMLVAATAGLVALALLLGMSAIVLPAAGAVVVAAAALRVRPSLSRSTALGAALCLVVSCTHPGQTALGVGQCLLDNGVLAEVLAALGKPDYTNQVEQVGLSHASDLVDCALQSVASKPTQPSGGSGSGSTQPAVMAAETMQGDVLSARAREVLAARMAAGK